MTTIDKDQLANRVADYLESHPGYDALSKRGVAISAVKILTDDLGAATDFLHVIGLNIDLYRGTDNITIGRIVQREDVVVVSLTVVTDNPEHITKAAEVMGRAAAGLTLDGMSISLTLGRGDAEEVDDS